MQLIASELLFTIILALFISSFSTKKMEFNDFANCSAALLCSLWGYFPFIYWSISSRMLLWFLSDPIKESPRSKEGVNPEASNLLIVLFSDNVL